MNTLLLLASLSASPLAVAAPAAASTGPVVCTRTAHVVLTPGLTMAAQDFALRETGRFTSCSGPGADGLTGVFEVRGATGHGGCTGATVDAPTFTIRWSDGTESLGRNAEVVATPPVATGAGKIVSGRFAGRTATVAVLIVPQNPAACSTSGVTEVDTVGEFTFE